MLHCDWGHKVRGLEGKEKGGGVNETGLGRSLAYTGGSFSTWREGYNNVTWWLDCSIQSNSAHLQTESFHQLCTVSQTIYINYLFNELYTFNFFLFARFEQVSGLSITRVLIVLLSSTLWGFLQKIDFCICSHFIKGVVFQQLSIFKNSHKDVLKLYKW